MKILVVGAGGIGGYFGGRLADAGQEVSFLVRAGRAAQLGHAGLVIRSPKGDLALPAPRLVSAEAPGAGYDLVMLSCKAYDLEGAMDAFAPAVGPETAILPLLNGMAHMDRLDARFGAAAVLGGLAQISASLDAEGRILHHSDFNAIVYGERDGARSPRAEAVEAAFKAANFSSHLSARILQDMWEKWVFIATAAGITSLMRASIGEIVAAGGAPIAAALLDECAAIAAGAGFPPGEKHIARSREMVTAAGSKLTASMAKDIERGGPVEAEQIVGDLLRRGGAGQSPVLAAALVHLKAYEARRAKG